MRLEDYFDFHSPESIRIKGTRIGIEHVLDEYLQRCLSPEAIRERFPSLSLEQVYATILYYLHNRRTVDQYMSDWTCAGEQAYVEQQANLTPQLRRLKTRMEQIKSVRQSTTS